MTDEQARNLEMVRRVAREEALLVARERSPAAAAVVGSLKSKMNWLMVGLGSVVATGEMWWPFVRDTVIPLLSEEMRIALLPIAGVGAALMQVYLRAKTFQSIIEKGMPKKKGMPKEKS